MHEKRIEVRWRDVDNYGHVNNAVYLTYLEEVRDEWLARTLRDDEAVWDYVVAHVSIDFRREITQADDEVVAVLPAGADRQVERPDARGDPHRRGPLAAEAHAVLVARNRDDGALAADHGRRGARRARARPDGSATPRSPRRWSRTRRGPRAGAGQAADT